MKFKYNEEVTGALHFDSPIVALESTVIAHGLPYPENIETAYKLERIIRDNGAVPATIGVFEGEIPTAFPDIVNAPPNSAARSGKGRMTISGLSRLALDVRWKMGPA